MVNGRSDGGTEAAGAVIAGPDDGGTATRARAASSLTDLITEQLAGLHDAMRRLEGERAALQAENARLRDAMTGARAEAARWKDACERLAAIPSVAPPGAAAAGSWPALVRAALVIAGILAGLILLRRLQR